MRLFKLPLLMLVLLLLTMNCSTGPDFERDHYKDPESQHYSPDLKDLKYEINENQHVVLWWNEESIAEDGFLIQKKLLDHYQTIDTLAANSETYLDDSIQFATETYYRVVPFILKNEVIKIDSTNLGKWAVKLSFGHYSNLEFTNEEATNKLRVYWVDKTSIPTTSVIEFKVENDWIIMDTLQASSTDYLISTSDISYFLIDIRVKSLMKSFEGKFEPLNSLSLKDIELHYPTNIKLEVVYEDEVIITWNDNSHFESGFIINHLVDDHEESFHISANETSLQTRIKASFNPHTFQVKAIKEDEKSKSSTINSTINAYPLSNIKASHIDEDLVNISWFNPWEGTEDITRNILIERAEIEEGPFQVLDTLPPNANEFLDSNLNRNQTYYYKARSLSSRATSTIGIRNLTSLQLERQIMESASYLDEMVLTPDEKYLINVNFDSRLLTEFDIENNTKQTKEFSDHVLEKIKISPDGKFLAIYSNIDGGNIFNRGPNAVIILDRNSFSILHTLHKRTDGYQAFDFSHSSDELIVYDYNNESENEEVSVYDLSTGKVKSTVNFESSGCGESLFRSHKNDVYIINCYSKFFLFDSNTNERELLVDEGSWISKSTVEGDNLFYSSESIYRLNLDSMMKEEVVSYKNNFLLKYISTINSIIFRNENGVFMKRIDSDYTIELDKFDEPRIYFLEESDQLLVRDNEAFNYYNFEHVWSTIIRHH